MIGVVFVSDIDWISFVLDFCNDFFFLEDEVVVLFLLRLYVSCWVLFCFLLVVLL